MNKKVLFIEDEEALQRTLGDSLERIGYEITKATDGEEGLRAARQTLPDLILLDLILPKKSGFEVLDELKKDPSTKQIPVMVLTNLEGSADIERALAAGATTYLVKANYNLDDILAKIQAVFEHHA